MPILSIPSISTRTKRHLYSSPSFSSLPALSHLPLKPCNPNHNHWSLHCSNSLFLQPLFLLYSPQALQSPNTPPPLHLDDEPGGRCWRHGTKLGMMSYLESTGTVIPVTVGFREGHIVTRVKTEATDGYNAVQVGYRWVRDSKLTKPELWHFQKSSIIPLGHLQEFRLLSVEGSEPNQRLVINELFKEGDLVDVSSTTNGKGFQGPPTSLLEAGLSILYKISTNSEDKARRRRGKLIIALKPPFIIPLLVHLGRTQSPRDPAGRRSPRVVAKG